MYSMKDLCGWYNVGREKMRETLLQEGVIPATDKGKGNRARLSLSQLQPIFKKYGYPKGLHLQLSL